MRFLFLIIFVLMLVFSSTVLAEQGKDKSDKSNNGQGSVNSNTNSEKKDKGNQNFVAINASAKNSSPSAQNCDPNFPWKNHGEYVSCVAKLKLGGQSVSEAARSDIGKKDASFSASPIASGSASLTSISNQIQSFRNEIRDLIDGLKDLLKSLRFFR